MASLAEAPLENTACPVPVPIWHRTFGNSLCGNERQGLDVLKQDLKDPVKEIEPVK
jgi:hypothetical protein